MSEWAEKIIPCKLGSNWRLLKERLDPRMRLMYFYDIYFIYPLLFCCTDVCYESLLAMAVESFDLNTVNKKRIISSNHTLLTTYLLYFLHSVAFTHIRTTSSPELLNICILIRFYLHLTAYHVVANRE